MKNVVLAAAVAVCAPVAFGQVADPVQQTETELLNIDVRARAEWQGLWHDSDMDDANSGFEGKYLMMRLDGQIIPGLTYSWRQRFNKSVVDGNFFDATDWITIDYATRGWSFSAGKQVVAIGGWEYDRNPVDLYGTSVFWQNVPCYQFGVSAAYNFTPSDRLLFQVAQSMWHSSGNRNMYGYNLMYSGSHGPWSALYSVNLTEYAKGRYISYISLGNRVASGPFCLELDFMNRAASHQTFLFRDVSVIGDLSWAPDDRWKIHAKMTYDVNRTHTDADRCVAAGTELTMAGAGIEFMPLKKRRTSLRVHAACYYAWGRNANPDDLMQSKSTLLSVGVSWDMNLLRLKRKN